LAPNHSRVELREKGVNVPSREGKCSAICKGPWFGGGKAVGLSAGKKKTR